MACRFSIPGSRFCGPYMIGIVLISGASISAETESSDSASSVKHSARVWCAIDTLLSEQFEQLGEARDETNRRAKAAEESDA